MPGIVACVWRSWKEKTAGAGWPSRSARTAPSTSTAARGEATSGVKRECNAAGASSDRARAASSPSRVRANWRIKFAPELPSRKTWCMTMATTERSSPGIGKETHRTNG